MDLVLPAFLTRLDASAVCTGQKQRRVERKHSHFDARLDASAISLFPLRSSDMSSQAGPSSRFSSLPPAPQQAAADPLALDEAADDDNAPQGRGSRRKIRSMADDIPRVKDSTGEKVMESFQEFLER